MVRGGYAYSSSGCTIFKASLDGATSTVLARTTQCAEEGHIAVDNAYVYFTTYVSSPNTWTVRRVPIGGGPSAALVSTGKALRGLATDGTNVYWEEERYPDPGGPQSSVRAIPVGGGAPVDLATGLLALRGGLVVRDTDLFFADVNYVDTYRVMKVSTGGGSVTVLATVPSPELPTDIAVDDTKVYWTIKGAVKAVPSGGGTVETLVGGLGSPAGLVITPGELFWTETVCCTIRANGIVKKIPIAGGPVTILASARDWPGDIAADASHVYWVEGGAYGEIEGYGGIVKTPLTGGDVSAISDPGPGVLPPFAADDTNVYFANKWSVKKVPLAGGPVQQLAVAGFYIEEIATDGSYVYWIEGPSSLVRRVSVNGGPVAVVGFGGSGPPGPLAVDGAYAYWVDHFDKIVKAPKGGGPVITLASGLPFLSALVTDGTNLFFSEQDSGAVRRMSVNGGPISFVTLAEEFSQLTLALDQQNLYWIGQSNVVTVPKTGGFGTPIAMGLWSSILVPNGLAPDGRGGVYWTEAAGGTITAQFGVPPVTALSFAAAGSTVQEGAGPVLVKVQLTTFDGNPLTGTASVQYATADGSARAGHEYTATSGTLTVPAGTPSGALLTIPVTLLDDVVDEDDETFSITLSNVSGAALEPPTSHLVVVRDNDPPPSVSTTDATVTEGDSGTTSALFTVALSSASDRSVSVSFATLGGGSATAGDDYAAVAGTVVFTPGTTSKQVAVTVFGDRVFEAGETFLVELSNPINATIADAQGLGTIANDDLPGLSIADLAIVEPTSGTRTATFTVTLEPTSVDPVTVDYQTADGTAGAPSDYQSASGTLTFPPMTATQPISITINFDAEAEGPETFFVNLSNASGAPLVFNQGIGRIFDPGNFFTLAPCRLLDTRSPGGPYGGPALDAGQVRTFDLHGRCSIPASARAVSLNVTVTQPTTAGNLRMYEGGAPLPLVSSLNYSAGQTRGNNAVVGLSAGGQLSIRCAQAVGTAHVILDVNGYFE